MVDDNRSETRGAIAPDSPNPRSRHRTGTWHRLVTQLAILLLTATAVFAQSDPAPADPAPAASTGPVAESSTEAALGVERAAIEAIRSEIAAERNRLREAGESDASRPRLDRLREIERVTAASLQLLGDFGVEPPKPAVAASDEPASLGQLARFYDEIAADQSRIADLELALQASRESRRQAEEELGLAEREERRIAKSEGTAPDQKVAAHDRALLAKANVQLAALEENQTRRDLEAVTARLELLTRRADATRAELARSGGAVDASPFVDRADSLRIRLESVERRRESLDLQLEAASERYRRRADARPDLLDAVEHLRAVRDLVAGEEAVLRERLERLQTEEQTWTRWHRLITRQYADADLVAWLDESKRIRSDLERERLRAQGHLAARLEQLDAFAKRMSVSEPPAESRAAVEARGKALGDAVAVAREEIVELDRAIRLHTRFEIDASAQLGQVSLAERVARLWQNVSAVFAFELTAIDDQPITVGKALSALLLLLAGVMASGRASRSFGRVLARRAGLEPGVAGAAQTGTFYILLISFTLLALRLVNFPLTAFTVAGGALAIGIGFGSQNILNNFISGLIIMFERPIRSHDLVEIEGTHGTVEQVGLRSTRIRAQDGRHIVVPNSFFLENNVVNWTLSDELVRGMLAVGVIYGSDTRLVDQLIDRALLENDRVLREPAPVILFANFGDNSLDFHVFFWTRSRTPMGLQSVMSTLRFTIDRLFREAGLVIAFPQRDVHLDSASPIQIELIDRAGGRTAAITESDEEQGQ